VKITVDPRADRELEVFAQLGKGGDVATSDLEAICRMTSLWLRSGGNLRHVIKQLEGIGSSLQIPTRTGRIMSLGDGLAVTLKKYLRAKERFGLRSLLLGEIDLAELENPSSPPHTPERKPSDRTLQSELSAQLPVAEGRVGFRAEGRQFGRLQASGADDVDIRRHVPPAAAVASPGLTAAVGAVEDSPHISYAVDYAVATLPPLAEPVQADEPAVDALVEPADSATSLADNGQPTAGRGAQVAMRRYVDKAAHYKVKCPECGGALAVQEGCRKCHHCGWAAC
jgi:hypothetical protein